MYRNNAHGPTKISILYLKYLTLIPNIDICKGIHLLDAVSYNHIASQTNQTHVILNMSNHHFDPMQLNESQQLALGTYTSVTNQEPSAAVLLLQRSEWNVQVHLDLSIT